MSNVDDASDDELSCILAPLSSRGFYETKVNMVIQSPAERDENTRPLRRSARPTKGKPVPKDEAPKQYRKRTLSMSATQNDAKDTEVTVKKAKLEGQKAVSHHYAVHIHLD